MPTAFIRLGCGIDVSKDKIDVCFGGYASAGQFKVLASRKTFKNEAADHQRLILWLRAKLTRYQQADQLIFQVVMEATGPYHENLLVALHQAELNPCLERTDLAKKFLQSLGQMSKNDRIDAQGLCRLACERKLRSWEPFSSATMELRGVLRQRAVLIKDRTRCKNRLHAANSGHYANRAVKKAIKQLIKSLDRQIEILEREIHRLYAEDKKLRTFVDPIKNTFPGVGLVTLLTVFAETNGFDNISSRRALSRYAGLNVIQNQSGNTNGKTRISKRGNARIRAVLYMCALSVVRLKQGPLYAKYLRICERNPKARKVAVTAIQRQILEMIYTLFKSGETYDPNHVWQQSPPKANSSSTAEKNAPRTSLEAHGIAA